MCDSEVLDLVKDLIMNFRHKAVARIFFSLYDTPKRIQKVLVYDG